MSVILSLETSTDVCSAALHDQGTLLSEAEIHERQVHGAKLAVMVNQLMAAAGIDARQINAVAVTSGPGSYTGLRIGTSTAKGLCYALDIPLIAVGSLELLAFQARPNAPADALMCPMIDARRMEVYCLVTDSRLNVIEPVAARIIEESSFAELLADRKVLFFGNGSDKCKAVITHHNALFLNGLYPKASELGRMAEARFQAGEFEDLVHFQPFYLKEFVAKKPRGTSAS